MAKITPVPNGPLIKKTGKFKGSTLKSGGVIKKAQGGDTLSPYMQKRAAQLKVREENTRKRDSILQRNANAQGKTREEVRTRQKRDKGKQVDIYNGQSNASEKPDVRGSCTKGDYYSRKNGGPIKKLQNGGGGKAKKEYVDRMNTADSLMSASDRQIKDGNYLNMISNKPDWNRPSLRIGRENREKAKQLKNKKPLGPTRFKAGGMIKRADGSMSKRGLWDNIRANKGSGKKPTKQMLVQEKKIKAKSKK